MSDFAAIAETGTFWHHIEADENGEDPQKEAEGSTGGNTTLLGEDQHNFIGEVPEGEDHHNFENANIG